MSKNKSDREWRSCCPVSRCLEILGDKWTLLVVRDLMLGRTRFKEFMASPEAIPTNILTERLNRLVEHGVAEKFLPESGGKRYEYKLTEKGTALRPILKSMVKWGLKYEEGTKVGLSS